MDIKIKCVNCNEIFGCIGVGHSTGFEKEKFQESNLTEVKQVKVKVHGFATHKTMELLATQFNCPYCGHLHIVQLDDDKSLELFKKTIELFAKKTMLARKGSNVTEEMSKEFKMQRKLLTAYRTELMCKYNNVMITSEDNEELHKMELVAGYL